MLQFSLDKREALAVNQDALGKPARRVKQLGDCEVWRKPLADGCVAVALVNRGSVGSDVTVKASDVGLLDGPKLARNLWDQEDVADFTLELTQRVQPHETILLTIVS
jgi:alpha-galactosidase